MKKLLTCKREQVLKKINEAKTMKIHLDLKEESQYGAISKKRIASATEIFKYNKEKHFKLSNFIC